MSDLNNCSIVGRLTKDAELKHVGANNTALVSFTVANNTGFGQYARTNFFNVNVWGKAGENLLQYLTKGKQVGVTGTMENNKWTDNQGLQHDSWTIKSTGDIMLLASPKGQGNSYDEAPEVDETVF